MAGALRKTMLYLGLAEDNVDHDIDDGVDYYDDDDEMEVPMARDLDREREARVTPISRAQSARSVSVATIPSGDLRRITTVHPRTYNDAKIIGAAFRSGTPVIMNLSDMSDADAKRLVDFSAGLIFGLHGAIERVTNKVFLLSPANVEVSSEQDEPDEPASFFNQS